MYVVILESIKIPNELIYLVDYENILTTSKDLTTLPVYHYKYPYLSLEFITTFCLSSSTLVEDSDMTLFKSISAAQSAICKFNWLRIKLLQANPTIKNKNVIPFYREHFKIIKKSDLHKEQK